MFSFSTVLLLIIFCVIVGFASGVLACLFWIERKQGIEEMDQSEQVVVDNAETKGDYLWQIDQQEVALEQSAAQSSDLFPELDQLIPEAKSEKDNSLPQNESYQEIFRLVRHDKKGLLSLKLDDELIPLEQLSEYAGVKEIKSSLDELMNILSETKQIDPEKQFLSDNGTFNIVEAKPDNASLKIDFFRLVKPRKTYFSQPLHSVSVATQVNNILQDMLSETEYADKQIRLEEGKEGNLIVWVGADSYDEIEKVADAKIRDLIKAAAEEWSKRLGKE